MPRRLCPWWRQVPDGRPARRRARWWLTVEWLEDRTLFATDTFATAAPLAFTAVQTAHVSHFLADPTEVDLYRVHLSAGDSGGGK